MLYDLKGQNSRCGATLRRGVQGKRLGESDKRRRRTMWEYRKLVGPLKAWETSVDRRVRGKTGEEEDGES